MSESGGVTNPLHVLILTPFFPSDKNEVSGCFIAEPLKDLRRQGVESSVLAVSPLHYSRNCSIPSAPAHWVRYPQVPGVAGLSSAGKLLYARLLRWVKHLHRVKPIDVIHAHAALPCGHAAALLSEHFKIPFVVTVHGLDVLNHCAVDGISTEWRRNVSRDTYAAAQNVVCISSKVEQALKSGVPAGITTAIVYNGVDSDRFSPISSNEANLPKGLLVVGTLLPSKGHEVILRALARLKLSLPPVPCRIIGEGPDAARFVALARELGLEQQVQFVGRQSRAEVAAAMQRCSVFVLPSRNEGLGCVYLEAMSCAKPVIGCRGQGIEDVVEHKKNGWLIGPDAVEELADALSILLGSPDLSASLGATARQTILDGFTLADHAKRLREIYRHAIG